ncbi:MAG: TonB-dependent receptor [Salibacteraceae bacterium]
MQRLLITPLALLMPLITLCQVTVNGVVSDQNGEPIKGASVYLENSFLGSVTNASGEYQLKIKPGEHVVLVEHIGYQEIIDTIIVSQEQTINYELKVSAFLADEFVLEATRVSSEVPFTYQNLSQEELDQNNLGQDLPILLNQTVSAVTTSDAGAGVGYTGIRIRGSDATRINVTVNGVPINDAESHGVFWVNMPDFASTTSNLQIQRGVGTSSNGAGAFGASINLQTIGFDSNAYVELNNGYGSFNTQRHNVIYNSGLISDHFNFEGRLSYISSDGYIDRSASDLRSYYFSGGYNRKKLMVKAVVFSGREITQQAWWGTPESRINGDESQMLEHAINNGYTEEQTTNLLSSGRTYNYYTYDNEIDNYGQDHYQLITGVQITPDLYFNLTGHYTRGKGYFEQSKPSEDFADFGLEYPVIGLDTIVNSDLIVRRWLDNHFYGGVYSLQYDKGRVNISLGGSYNQYVGDHYGEVIWAEYATNLDIRDRYYFSDSKKNDLSNYIKAQIVLGDFSVFGDVQYRYIDYRSSGVDNDQRPIAIGEVYNFINPKLGLNWQPNTQNNFYVSVARASREPVRNDFTDALIGTEPSPEFLTNGEFGWHFSSNKVSISSNGFLMYYEDQLVLTGEVNDVGSPIRTNVPESYRVGLELAAGVDIYEGFYWHPNLTLSQNKITEFEETILDYTNGYDIVTVEHTNTDIAFSPSIIAGSQIGYRTDFGLHVALLTKYVGRQFLDNTSNQNRSIDPFVTNDIVLSYSIDSKYWKNLELSLLINNILDERYSSNGYTYSYIFGDLITENFYYPQAGTNWLAGVKWRF